MVDPLGKFRRWAVDAIASVKQVRPYGLTAQVFVPIDWKSVERNTNEMRGAAFVIYLGSDTFRQGVIVVTVTCVVGRWMAIALVNETCCDGLPFTAPEGVECIVIERRSAMPLNLCCPV